MKLDNNISAVVTGGASGLGEATARALAAKGVQVTLFDMNETLGQKVAREIDGHYVQVNVTDEQSVSDGFASAREKYGKERILVNCAGIGVAMKTVTKGAPHSLEFFTNVINVNLIGSFRCIAHSAAGMVAIDSIGNSGRGIIINTASVAAFDGQIGQAAYSASKGGVVGMTLPIARDLARDGVRVCAIAPGLFKTPMLASLPEDVQESLGAQVPFPSRLGNPDEYAHLAVHICENDMLNGETIRLDGAIRMAPK